MTSATGSETATRAKIRLSAMAVVLGWELIAAELIEVPDPSAALHGALGFIFFVAIVQATSLSSEVEETFALMRD
jgi:hypothetical protein